MVYYAYIKNIRDDSSWRYVAVFASRAVADEWWRTISSSGTKYADSVKRITPQFFTHDMGQANAADSTQANQVASAFIGKIIFTLMYDKGGRVLSVIPSPDFADHVSGNSFFIRSKVSPDEYWYCPVSPCNNLAHDTVYVSRTERTRFRVYLTGAGTAGTIMIGSDEIAITMTTADKSINIDDKTGKVMLAKNPELGLKFGDLVNRFSAGATLFDKNCKSLGVKELFMTTHGEEWELI
ncbi:hypothetical protein DFH29DRAFT_882235 [Suillus ampliporus]|nr:hypothetical protein DFH29DRAFT_882235 [Suillus ampliporus]